MKQERAQDAAFVIEPDGRIHDLKRAGTLPTTRELRHAVGGDFEVWDLEQRQGLAMIVPSYEDESLEYNNQASMLVKQPVSGRAIVLAKRLLPERFG